MDYLLFYEYCADVLERRGPLRSEHLERAWEAQARGELVLAGAFANPVDGAVFHFRTESPDVVVKFAETDPYVRGGLVTRWHYREWTTVVGDAALTPVGRPT
ncbi:MAG TPA: YciI-like protein [Candidatus Limnocylindrales bacterium]|nr:YciI-like protein [Candidatus Limnocylindrales bacterium]